jgi:hypothetical protein
MVGIVVSRSARAGFHIAVVNWRAQDIRARLRSSASRVVLGLCLYTVPTQAPSLPHPGLHAFSLSLKQRGRERVSTRERVCSQ